MKQYVKPDPAVNNCPMCGGRTSLFIANGHDYTRNPGAVQAWLLCHQCGFGMTKPVKLSNESNDQVKAQLAEYWNRL